MDERRAPRYYIVAGGSTGIYVLAEVLAHPTLADGWARPEWFANELAGDQDGWLVVNEANLVALPDGAEALDAWEQRDESVMLAAMRAEFERIMRENTKRMADAGDAFANLLLEQDDIEGMYSIY